MIEALIAAIVFMLGMAAGAALEARSWRKNATDYRRKESAGKLYRVRDASLIQPHDIGESL